jgi:hypothetical protein
MQRKQRGSAAAGLLLAAALSGVAGFAAGMRSDEPAAPQQGAIVNGRYSSNASPALPDPAAQRKEMIQALHSIDQKMSELDARMVSMKEALDAIERHERATYLLLGNQKEASPNEKNR